MKVSQILSEAKHTLFTFEILPPLKGHTLDGITSTVDKLRQFNPAYFNITNHQIETVYEEKEDGTIIRKTVRKRPGTIALSAALQYRYSIPVVPHIICGGMSADEIENVLIELNFLGIENVFALRGDPPKGERRFVPCHGGWEHTDQLVRQIQAMNEGRYLDDELKDPVKSNFCIGVAGYPEKHFEAANKAIDIRNLKRKQDAGADYIVTQLFYDNEAYFSFVRECREEGITIPIIPGIKPFSKKRDLTMLPQTFSIDIPSELYDAVDKAGKPEEIRQIGIDWSISQVRQLIAAKVPAVHFYTMGSVDSVAKVVRESF
jgi:methylenetetrahydrofolate reductase (NADPH)